MSSKPKFKVGEIVYIKNNGYTGVVERMSISTMGHNVYFLETMDFDKDYPFYEKDLKSVDKELEEQNYSNYLDANCGALYLDKKESPKKEQKPRFSLLTPGFIEEMMGVMEFGAIKYTEGDWVNTTSERDCVDAAIRHILAYKKGQDFDVESGLSHFSHAATRLMMAYFHMQNSKKR